jgi:hypothetical protein
MVAHYAQKISVGIALVCMVNHTAISQHQTSVDTPLTQMDIDCPRLKGSVQIVSKKNNTYTFISSILCRMVHMLGRRILKVLF